MSRKTFKKLCIITTSALFLATSLSFGMDKVETSSSILTPVFGKEGRDKTTQTFVPENQKVIDAFRAFYKDHGSRAKVEPLDMWIPFVQDLLTKMERGTQNVHISKLQQEIKENLASKSISLERLTYFYLGYLALVSTPSETEISLLDHTPSYPGYFKAFFKNDLHGNPVVMDILKLSKEFGAADHHGRNVAGLYVSNISYEARKQIKKELKKQLPLPFLYPLLGESTLNPHFIGNCWLDEVRPFGMPLGQTPNVHGELASPLGFTYHDWFHYLLDSRRRLLQYYIEIQVSEAVQNGAFASDVIPALVPLAVEKYKMFMNALKHANQAVVKDNYAFTGFFFMINEYPALSLDFLEKSNLPEVLEGMLKGSLKSFKKNESWDNPNDILRTSPLNGQSALTEEQIKNAVQERVIQNFEKEFEKNNFYKFSMYPPYTIYEIRDDNGNVKGHITDKQEQQQCRKNWLIENMRIKVETSDQFIDGLVEFKDGDEIIYTFPTLKRKWNNFGASEGMLKYAGVKLRRLPLLPEDKPITFTDKNSGKPVNISIMDIFKKNRETAINFVKLVNEKIQGTMKDFVQKANTSFGQGEGSYAATYAQKFEEIQKKMDKVKEGSKN